MFSAVSTLNILVLSEICKKLHLDLSEAACWFFKSFFRICLRCCMLSYDKLNLHLPKYADGFARNCMMLGLKLHVDLSDAAYGYARSFMWICLRFFLDLLDLVNLNV